MLEKEKNETQKSETITLGAEKIIIFKAYDEYFSLPLTEVSSCGFDVNASPLPQMPSFIEGILTVRGEMIPAVNLAKRLQLGSLEKTAETCHIIIKREKGKLALIVDEIVEIIRFDEKNIQAVPEYLETASHGHYIRGIFESNRGVVSLLDLEDLFSKKQLDQLTSFEQVSYLKHKSKGKVETEEVKQLREKMEKLKTLVKDSLGPSVIPASSSVIPAKAGIQESKEEKETQIAASPGAPRNDEEKVSSVEEKDGSRVKPGMTDEEEKKKAS